MSSEPTIGEHLRTWRQRRRMTQLDLALDAEISARHLCFVETGRARPSRDMVLHLSETLEVPLRSRNALLQAAGYAPVYVERALDHPDLAAARAAIELVLVGCEPFPAVAVDRYWNVVGQNKAVALLLEGVAPDLLTTPNAMRLALHPKGLAPCIENYAEWCEHLLARLRQQIARSGDSTLEDLLAQVAAYPAPDQPRSPPCAGPPRDRCAVASPAPRPRLLLHLDHNGVRNTYGRDLVGTRDRDVLSCGSSDP